MLKSKGSINAGQKQISLFIKLDNRENENEQNPIYQSPAPHSIYCLIQQQQQQTTNFHLHLCIHSTNIM